MNIYDIIGPIMIGPSSSHTAGVVRIGLLSNRILNCVPKKVTIVWYGSFAKTYVGHGSDKAIIAGLLGMTTDDENIRNSLELAKEAGMEFEFKTSNEEKSHPNTLKIIGINDLGEERVLMASSLGGGSAVITKIDDIDVVINGSYDTIFVRHKDERGVVKDVTNVLYEHNINIATFTVNRSERSGDAIMLIEIDDELDEAGLEKLRHVKNLKKVSVVKKV